MDNDGNVLITNSEIRQAIKKIEAQEQAKVKEDRAKEVAKFKKRAGVK